MGLELKITMMLLFANIALTLVAPSQVLGGNLFYEMQDGEYKVSNDITGTVNNIDTQGGGLDLNEFGILDALKMLAGVIDLFIRLFFASLLVAYSLPGVVALVVGVPLVLAYMFAIVGWIR